MSLRHVNIPRPSPPTAVATALTVGVAAFQIALASGAPWGAAAWGGTNPGTLPPGLRAASAGSALVYAGLAVTLASGLVPGARRRRILTVAAGAMVLGTVLNLASPSGVERALWTPVAAALAASLWLARADADLTHRP
ncbi:hypothetical protein CLV92_11327 [Kineococcus xinjiangensis]|uniref:Tryptophan-associated transmembrane protein n=1 Tax=Kineococcus xinjiangensis TaxID=512762 RepID=A0A2S6IEF4_9ACTN|nr:hypothetical protein [Kineococcus xinjiangensis]PPK92598.1 hypothetical protein CLV92_11327 [Kineococcus xinjiangensis]